MMELKTSLQELQNAYGALLPAAAVSERASARFLRACATERSMYGTQRTGFSVARFAFLGTGVLACLFILLAGMSVTAFSILPGALPGDALYGVKLATEQVLVSFAFTPGERAKLALEFAGHRVEEAAKLSESSRPDRDDQLAAVVDQFRVQIANTQSQLASLAGQDESATEVATIVDRKASEYGAALERAGARSPERVQTKVRAAQDASQAASFTAVTVLLEKQRSGEVSLVEVQRRVSDKLHELENTIQVLGHRLTAIPSVSYPAIQQIGGPTLPSLYQTLSDARETLGQGKDYFARGGYDAALKFYQQGTLLTNQLEWGVGLYEQAQQVGKENTASSSK